METPGKENNDESYTIKLRLLWKTCWRFQMVTFYSEPSVRNICSKFCFKETSLFPWVAPEMIMVARFSEVSAGVIAIPQASLVPSQQQNMLSWQPAGLLLLMLIKTYPCKWVCVYMHVWWKWRLFIPLQLGKAWRGPCQQTNCCWSKAIDVLNNVGLG